MTDLFVTGEVEPSSGNWFIDDTIVLGDPEQEGPLWQIAIRDSRMIINITNATIVDRDTFLFATVREVAQACADALGFQVGVPLRVHLLSVRWDDGRVGFLHAGWPQLAGRNKTAGIEIPHASVVEIAAPVLKSPFLRHALADLQQGIDRHDDTAFYCFRAIEGCRQVFIEGEDDRAERKRSWARLHALCETTETELAVLQNHAVPRRHGGFSEHLTQQDRFQFMQLARRIFLRVSEHVAQSE
jgi:hypothetical protein